MLQLRLYYHLIVAEAPLFEESVGHASGVVTHQVVVLPVVEEKGGLAFEGNVYFVPVCRCTIHA